jgi:hypothetical protein
MNTTSEESTTEIVTQGPHGGNHHPPCIVDPSAQMYFFIRAAGILERAQLAHHRTFDDIHRQFRGVCDVSYVDGIGIRRWAQFGPDGGRGTKYVVFKIGINRCGGLSYVLRDTERGINVIETTALYTVYALATLHREYVIFGSTPDVYDYLLNNVWENFQERYPGVEYSYRSLMALLSYEHYDSSSDDDDSNIGVDLYEQDLPFVAYSLEEDDNATDETVSESDDEEEELDEGENDCDESDMESLPQHERLEEEALEFVSEVIGGITDTNSKLQSTMDSVEVTARKAREVMTSADGTLNTLQRELDCLRSLTRPEDGSIPLWESILARCEDAVIMIIGITHATSITALTSAILAYIKTMVSGSLIAHLAKYVHQIVSGIVQLYNQIDAELYEQSSGAAIDFIAGLSRNWKIVIESPLLKEINNMLTVVMAIVWTGDPEACQKVSERTMGLLQAKCWDFSRNGAGFVDMVLSSVTFFLKKGTAVLNGASINCLMFDDDQLDKIDRRYSRAISWEKIVRQSDIDSIGVLSKGEYSSRQSYVTELEEIKLFYEKLRKQEKWEMARNSLNAKIYKIDNILTDILTSQKKVAFQKECMCLGIFGGSGVAKSFLVQLLYKAMCTAINIDATTQRMCFPSESAKFDDEYNPNTHHTIVMDDLCNTRAEWYQASPLNSMIVRKNIIPSAVVKSDVSEKGKYMYALKNLIYTTNVKDLKSAIFSNNPASIMRRVDLVLTIEPAPGFTGSRGTWENTSGELIPDGWTVIGEVVKVIRGDTAEDDTYEFRKVFESSNIAEICGYVGSFRKEFEEQQDANLCNMRVIDELKFCEHFCPPAKCPICSLDDQCKEGRTIEQMDEKVLDEKRKQALKMLKAARSDFQEFMKGRSRQSRDEDLGFIPPAQIEDSERSVDELPKNEVLEPLKEEGASMSSHLNDDGSDDKPCPIQWRSPNNPCPFHNHAICQSAKDWAEKKRREVGPIVRGQHSEFSRTMNVAVRTAAKCADIGLLKIYNALCATPPIVTMGLGAVGLLTLYMRLRNLNLGEQSVPTVPEPVPGEKSNDWTKKKIMRTPFPIRCTHKAASTSPNDLVNMISKSLAAYKVEYMVDGKLKVTTGSALPLRGNLWLIPSHMAKPGCLSLSYCDDSTVGLSKVTCQVGESDIARIDGKDIAVVRVTALPIRKGYIDYFPLENVVGNVYATLITRIRRDWLPQDPVRNAIIDKIGNDNVIVNQHVAMLNGLCNATVGTGDKANSRAGYYYKKEHGTFPGLCGSVAVTMTNKTVIAGIHIAGSGTKGFVHPVTKDLLETAMASFDRHIQPGEGGGVPAVQYDYSFEQPSLMEEGCKEDDIPDSHPVKWLDNSVPSAIEVFGPHSGGSRTLRSCVQITPISDTVEEVMGLERKHGKPKHINTYRPWQSNLAEIAAPENRLDPDILSDAGQSFSNFLLAKAKKVDGAKYLHVWTYESAIQPIEGVNGADGLNLTTSMGLPIGGPKRRLAEGYAEVDEFGNFVVIHLDPEVERLVNDMIERAKAGERIYALYQANVKDEPTKFTKDKLRVFAGTQLAFLIVCKMYLGGLNRMFQNHWEEFECCVSANCYNSDWTKLYHAVFNKSDGKRCIAGDYAHWDKSMTPQLTLTTGQAHCDVLRWGGYDSEDLMVVRALYVEFAYPIYEWNGVYIQALGSLPSGVFATVMVSNGNNSILFRYSYMSAAPLEQYWRYDEHICANFMGDDNIADVSDSCTWFDMKVHAKCLEQAGITYTSADKQSELLPFVTIDEVTYLKRRFVWSDDVQNYIAPIEETSISKSLHCYMKRKHADVLVEQQCASAIDSAYREYFRHGRGVYERRSEQLWEVAQRHKIIPYLSMVQRGDGGIRPYRYDELVERYLSGDTWMDDSDLCIDDGEPLSYTN